MICPSSYSDLPKLETLQLSDYALRGDEDHRLVGEKPFTFQNHLVLKSSQLSLDYQSLDLPSLTTLIGGNHAFQCIGTIRLESWNSNYQMIIRSSKIIHDFVRLASF